MFSQRSPLAAVVSLCCALAACTAGVDSHAESLQSSAAVPGATCDPQNAEGIALPLQRALLDTIAFTEGTRDHGKDGYNVTFAYHYFDRCDEHPNLKFCSGSLCSTAAGRYQFLYKTYQGLALPNFWPEQQERGALELIERRGVSLPATPLTATQFANALDKLSYEWSSLPPGRYGQTRRTLPQIRDEYCRLAQCGTGLAPAQSLPVNRGHNASGFYAINSEGVLHRYQLDAMGEFVRRTLTFGWDTVTSMGAGADYDLDGEADFVTQDFEYGLELQLGDGAGDFWYLPLVHSGEALVLFGAAADYDHDALPDFIALDAAGELQWARGDGAGQFDFAGIAAPVADIKAIGGGADYDHDGHADFVVLRSDGSSTLYCGDGAGRFRAQRLELDASRLRLLGGGADYTGDGYPDLLAITFEGEAYLYTGQAEGTFKVRALSSDWDDVMFVD